MVGNHFKIFWDGTLSMFPESVLASSNNKQFVEKLLNVRTENNDHKEPSVALIHGKSEAVLRAALLRIKIEQAEAAEAAKRRAKEEAARNRGEDEESEEEEEEPEQDLDDSQDKQSTFA